MTARLPIAIHWEATSFTGWGVYGVNLACQWANDDRLAPVFSFPINQRRLSLPADQEALLAPIIARSSALIETLATHGPTPVTLDHPIIHAMGNNLVTSAGVLGFPVFGRPDFACIFAEDTEFDPAAIDTGRRYARIIAGSSWNAETVRRAGLDNVVTVLQGIDGALFNPGEKLAAFPGRYAIFAGGKLEWRKGQDIVLAAFRAFRQRHPEALLVTAWTNGWTPSADRIGLETGLRPPPRADNGRIDVIGWATENSLPADSIVDLGLLPNREMAKVYRAADIGVFTSRCEAGTNLVAMEAMASGLPCILSANTGHLDLIDAGSCLALNHQQPVAPALEFRGTAGWGESDVEELLAAMEHLYLDRDAAATIGAAGAELLHRHDWRTQTARLKDVVLSAL